MSDESVVARLAGLRPWGATRAQTVELREGDVYYVGRLDQRWLRQTGRQDRHLALGPTTRATVSAVSLTIVVTRDAVEVSPPGKLVDVMVDSRAIGLDPLLLRGPFHELIFDPSGAPQTVVLRFPSRVGTAEAPRILAGSGSTVVPVLSISGGRHQMMAAALVWPLLRDVAPPLSQGWSSQAAAARYHELWGSQPSQPSRLLFDLRQALENAHAEDGRAMASIDEVQPWPWAPDLARSGYATADEFIEGKNHVTAVHLAAGGRFSSMVAKALERTRVSG